MPNKSRLLPMKDPAFIIKVKSVIIDMNAKGIAKGKTGFFRLHEYSNRTISVRAANIWLEAPKMGHNTQPACVDVPVEGSTMFQRANKTAGITATAVAIYRFLSIEMFTASPNSVIIKRWILVAVSRVVAAKEITRTAINPFAISAGIPKACINAPPPSTNAAALFAVAFPHVS